jgi:NADPH:quinone reductase-like Zn-dependent oxidoreductase
MKLLVGAMALARLQPNQVRAPQSVPTTEVLERVSGMVSAGQLRPVVDRIFSLEDAPAAIRHVETEHARGKVVIAVA